MGTTVTITKLINAPPERVYQALLTPADIMQYHYADEGWKTPYAEIDAQPNGKFRIGFQSPDGTHDFAFEGTFTQLTEPSLISYLIGDGRPVTYTLAKADKGQTELSLELGLEEEHTPEQQRAGWSSIMDHLKTYLESNTETKEA